MVSMASLSNATAFARVAAVNRVDADAGGVNGGWSACNGF